MDDWTAMMTEQRLSDHDLTVETERFKDYCLTHGKRYRDWIAAWRNWMRSPYRKPVPPPPMSDEPWRAKGKLDHVFDRLAAERAAKQRPPEPDNVIDVSFYRPGGD